MGLNELMRIIFYFSELIQTKMLLWKCLWGFVATNKEGLLQANGINWVKLLDIWRTCCRSWLSTEAQQTDPNLESEMKTVTHGLEVHSHSPDLKKYAHGTFL